MFGVLAHGRPGRVFYRILGSFLLLLIPTVSIGLVTYGASTQRVRTEFAERTQLSLDVTVESVDRALRNAQELSQNVLYDRHVIDVVRPHGQLSPEQRVRRSTIPPLLARTRSLVSDYVTDLFLYIDDRRVYHPSGVDYFDVFFERFSVYDGLTTRFWKLQLSEREGTRFVGIVDFMGSSGRQPEKVVPIVTTGLVHGNRAVVVVNFPVEHLRGELASRRVSETMAYVVMDGDGRVILADPADSVDLISLDPTGAGSEGSSPVHSHAVVRARSETFGWDYYAIMPVRDLRAYSTGIVRLTALVAVVLALGGGFAALYLSVKLYSPIRGIRDTLSSLDGPAPRFPAGRRDDEFQQIRSAVANLIEDRAVAERTREISRGEFVSGGLISLLQTERPVDSQTLCSLLAHAGFARSAFVVVGLVYQERNGASGTAGGEEIGTGVFGRVFSHVGAPLSIRVFDRGSGYVVGIVNADHESLRGALERSAVSARGALTDLGLERAFVAHGRVVRGLQQLSRSHSDVITGLRKLIRSEQSAGSISYAAETDVFHFPLSAEQSLISLLQRGQSGRMEHALSRVVRENIELDISQVALDALFHELVYCVLRFREEYLADLSNEKIETQLIERAVSPEWSPLGYRAALDACLGVWRSVAEQWNAVAGSRDVAAMQKVARFVSDHYGDPSLCIDKVSRAIGLTPKHVSRQFVRFAGKRLSDHIRLVRIAKARDLLRADPAARIEDVAAAVGMPSRATFERVFKSVEGLSPGKYRAMYSSSNGI